MKKLFASILALASIILAPVAATAQTIVPGGNVQQNVIFQQTQQVGTAYTNSTTTATNVTNLSLTVPASIMAPSAQYLEICYYAQASKATAGTGTLSLLVNGVAQAPAARTIPVSAQSPVATCYYMARPVAGAFAVTVQGVSSDTNAFGVSQGQLSVQVFFTGSL